MVSCLFLLSLQANKGDSAAALHQLQEKDKLIAAMKEEAAVAKEQCKQLSQVWCLPGMNRLM